MKKALIFIFLFIGFNTYAQTADEFLQQKKLEKRYRLEWIIQNMILNGTLKNGLDIVKKGLNTIHDIKNGNFKLDEIFLDRLKNVNGFVGSVPYIVEIIETEIFVLEVRKLCLQHISNNPGFFVDSFDNQIEGNFDLILELVANDIADIDLALSNTAEFTDDERLERIIQVAERAELKREFAIYLKDQILAAEKGGQQIILDQNFLQKLGE